MLSMIDVDNPHLGSSQNGSNMRRKGERVVLWLVRSPLNAIDDISIASFSDLLIRHWSNNEESRCLRLELRIDDRTRCSIPDGKSMDDGCAPDLFKSSVF